MPRSTSAPNTGQESRPPLDLTPIKLIEAHGRRHGNSRECEDGLAKFIQQQLFTPPFKGESFRPT